MDPDRLGLRPHRGALIGAVVMLIAVVAIGVFATRSDDDSSSDSSLPLDAWMPYWTLDETSEARADRIGLMREVSPFWFNATGVESITLDPNADTDATELFFELARESGAEVVPSIVDALPAGEMAAILADTDTRDVHVQTIVDFARELDVDGIDLDYEQFAFSDGRDTWESTRPNWVAFVEQLADSLHADGRTLTVSIPPIYDDERSDTSGFWVYDHGAISEHVDRIRIMAYDYSVPDPGPIAPLDFVRDSIDGPLEAGADPDKLVLGIPIYGRNWPTGVSGTCPEGTELEDTLTVTLRTIDDLVERREAEPVYDDATGEWSFDYEIEFTDGTTTCTQSRSVHYVGPDGARRRAQLARDVGLSGAALWAFGFDDEQVWNELAPIVNP